MSRRSVATSAAARPPYARLLVTVARVILGYAGLLLGLLVFCIPPYYMITTSVKNEGEVFAVPIHWLPEQFQPQNYVEAFAVKPFGLYFVNSTFVALSVVLITLFFCALAGYGLSKYKFPGRDLVFYFILSTMMVPFQVTIIPLYVLVYKLGWTNNFLGVIVPSSVTAFGVFLMRQFLITVPDELIDAARIDGAGEFAIFWRVGLPLLRPPMATLAILTFIGSWNDFLWPLLVITKDELFTLPLGMAAFTQPLRQPYWTYIMAVSTVASLPVVAIFVLLQRYFIQGVVLSGMKG